MATETTQQIDVNAQAAAFIDKIQTMNLNTFLNEWLIPYGTKLVLAIAIYIIGKWIAKHLSHIIGRIVGHSSDDDMLQSFISSISYFLMLLIVVIAALSQLGINTASLVALIGAAGLAVGLALQNSLQNFAAGVMILIFKPFRKGDYVEAGGVAGTVNQIGILMLELNTGDNKAILVPNGKIFAGSITNYSKNQTRRIDFIFDIAYEADIEEAKNLVAQILKEESRILTTPAPLIAVGSLAASSVQLFVRPWVNAKDYWAVRYAITEKLKIEFDKADISIPYNQLDIRFPDQNSEQKIASVLEKK